MMLSFWLGLAGSWHCAAMCSGLTWGQRPLSYLLGRLLGYTSLGLLLGMGGKWLLPWLGSRLLLAASGGLVLAMGLARGGGEVRARNRFSLRAFLWRELSPWLRRPGPRARFLLGLSSALFPCGLLYAACLQALNQPGPAQAGLSMLAFWAGSLPGLLAPRWLAGRMGTPAGLEQVALLLAGSSMLAWALWPEGGGGHCL